ncbi:Hypothetical predicted protein [Marmota monax]|uniref:Uncharacterized protein n=1 Tax=Marmota monax TaxID=9995 RepID=A0A5E4A4M3_MARMO|nr:hypothetical protein GHT09_003152 [Marmota monax]VTJ52187.1 Hypothetical predicted protein [Marmota monax]
MSKTESRLERGPRAGCGLQKSPLGDFSEEDLVTSTQFPWVVSIQDLQYTHLAFGCILSEFWILTIASAFQNRPVPLPWGARGRRRMEQKPLCSSVATHKSPAQRHPGNWRL